MRSAASASASAGSGSEIPTTCSGAGALDDASPVVGGGGTSATDTGGSGGIRLRSRTFCMASVYTKSERRVMCEQYTNDYHAVVIGISAVREGFEPSIPCGMAV